MCSSSKRKHANGSDRSSGLAACAAPVDGTLLPGYLVRSLRGSALGAVAPFHRGGKRGREESDSPRAAAGQQVGEPRLKQYLKTLSSLFAPYVFVKRRAHIASLHL